MIEESRIPGFFNNFIQPAAEFPELGIMSIGGKFDIHERTIRNTHLILKEGALIHFTRCRFEHCNFTIEGNLAKGSYVVTNSFLHCRTQELQRALIGYSVGE